MSRATSARLAAACAACLAISGCGHNASRTSNASDQSPRRLELPANIRLVPLDASTGGVESEPQLAPAQYQQPPTPALVPSPRIREFSLATEKPGVETIREPVTAPSDTSGATTSPPRRSEFVPITIPSASIPPPPQLPPQLPLVEQAFLPATASPPPRVGQAFVSTTTRAPQSSQPPAKNATPAQAPSPPATQNSTPPQAAVAVPSATQRAMQIANQADLLAQRGMFYSARTELIGALQLIAQSLDVQEGSSRHADSLAAGLTALDEARDFSPLRMHSGDGAGVASLAATHRTSVLWSSSAAQMSPVAAQQQYFAFAQAQLTLAAGGVPAASQVLYRLGRLQTAMAAHDSDPNALHALAAIVFHQAALAADSRNWLAANELGVLFARYGQLPEAKQMLLHSVSTHPHVAGWQNLAAVHRRLGETDLAQRAENERQRLASQTAKTSSDSGEMVHWVDTKTFAAGSGPDIKWPDISVAAAPGATRR